MKYQYLIFDVDGTLLDFSRAYANAQQAVAKALEIKFSSEFVQTDEELGWKLWDEFGLNNVKDETIQQNYHSLYDAYLRKHFECVAEAFGKKARIQKILDTYYAALSSTQETMERDTLEIYQALSQGRKMLIATNGLGKVQRGRLKDFTPMTSGLYISEEVGSIKPSRKFFEQILIDLNGAPCGCLMIGDSLSSDIYGAKNIGMATCWYNPKQRTAPTAAMADFSISKLSELCSIV